jgi:hypothetical protein
MWHGHLARDLEGTKGLAMTSPSFFSPQGGQVRLNYPIPYYSQFASPELVEDIVNSRLNARDDPRWREFGASTPQEYEYWAWKACGIAALKMALEALGIPRRSMMDWIRDALAVGGFIFEEKVAPGKPSGWLHRALADLARNHGFSAGCAAPVDLDYVADCIDRGLLTIASVSYELGTRGDITRNRGHLILIHGYSRTDDGIEALHVNNPSGRSPELRRNCWIPAPRFTSGFSGRVILFGPPLSALPGPQ